MSRIIGKSYEALVLSYGGVGTTFLLEHLQRYKKVNCPYNTDGYKHLPTQPLCLNRQIKIVYVFGNTTEAVTSLFSRNFQRAQSRNLCPNPFYSALVPKTDDLASYAERGKDYLHIKSNITHWTTNRLGYAQFFVHYDHIWDCLVELHKFLDIPQTEIEHFPKRKKRSNKPAALLSAKVKDNLFNMYQSVEYIQKAIIPCSTEYASKTMLARLSTMVTSSLLPTIFIGSIVWQLRILKNKFKKQT